MKSFFQKLCKNKLVVVMLALIVFSQAIMSTLNPWITSIVVGGVLPLLAPIP